jgi:hypothetical protein
MTLHIVMCLLWLLVVSVDGRKGRPTVVNTIMSVRVQLMMEVWMTNLWVLRMLALAHWR